MVAVTKGMTGHDMAEATIEEVKDDMPHLQGNTVLTVALIRVCTKYVLRESLLSDVGESHLERAAHEMRRLALSRSEARHPSGGTDPSAEGGTGQDGRDPGAAGVDPDPADLPDDDLPGMWEKADFLGGQEDTHFQDSITCPNCEDWIFMRRDPTNTYVVKYHCPRCQYTEER